MAGCARLGMHRFHARPSRLRASPGRCHLAAACYNPGNIAAPAVPARVFLTSPSNNLRSIYAMLTAAGMFSLMDTAMKLLSEHYPAMQVTALRALSSLPLVCLYLLYRGAFKNVLQVRWPLHVLRGALA